MSATHIIKMCGLTIKIRVCPRVLRSRCSFLDVFSYHFQHFFQRYFCLTHQYLPFYNQYRPFTQIKTPRKVCIKIADFNIIFRKESYLKSVFIISFFFPLCPSFCKSNPFCGINPLTYPFHICFHIFFSLLWCPSER